MSKKAGSPVDVKPLSSHYWTIQEDLSYYFYVQMREQSYASTELRRKNQVFSAFSSIIKTRAPPQVKSHHQKLMKRHKTVNKFLKFYEKRNSKLIQEESDLKKQIENSVAFLTGSQERKSNEAVEIISPEKITWLSYINMDDFHSDFVIQRSDDLFQDYD